MRSIFRAMCAVAALAGVSGTALAQQAPIRIAYVNPQALFQSAPGREQAEAAFQKETEGYRAELGRIGEALSKMVADYQREEAQLSAANRERRQRAIAAKEDSLRQRQQELEEQAGRRQSELMAPIMESVRKVLEDIRAEDGYAMILSSEPGASPILVADRNLDITDRVVARLRTLSVTRPAATPARPSGTPTATPAGVTRPRPPGE
ncbi:MAG: OmpH family outer membrane protein [Gemmatimonadaceae bacterium]